MVINKINIIVLLVMVLLFIPGCAQVHPGNIAVQIDSNGKVLKDDNGNKVEAINLIVSGEEYKELSSRYFGVIDFTFENKTDMWIRIKEAKVYFENENINKNIIFTSGKDFRYGSKPQRGSC